MIWVNNINPVSRTLNVWLDFHSATGVYDSVYLNGTNDLKNITENIHARECMTSLIQ